MKLKTLLLGSATALAVTGGAQAADLSVAEPVDYVRVCDAFGTGYWYVPGTDVCIKIWGLVRWQVNFYGEDGYFQNDYSNYEYGYPSENHWDFPYAVLFSLDAKSMTDWGPLEAYMDAWNWGFNEGYISLGPLLAGYTQSLFNLWGGYTLDNEPYGGWYQSEHRASQIRLTWAMNGFGLAVGLEKPNYQTEDFAGYDKNTYTYDSYSSMPDIVAALTFSNASFDGKIAFVYSDYLHRNQAYDWEGNGDNVGSSGWAITAGVVLKLDSIAPGDALLLKAAYGDANPYVLGSGTWSPGGGNFMSYYAGGTSWSVLGSFKHYFQPNFYASITGNYAHNSTGTCEADSSGFSGDCIWNISSWQAEFDLSYSPAPTLWITPAVRWISSSATWNGGPWTWNDWMATIRIEKTLF
jgi:hypothetical protein